MTDEPRSPLLRTLAERGFVHQATDLGDLDALLLEGPVSGYIGFDLTAPSLHVGSMIQLMVLRHMKAHGHEPFVLFGDATTRVGDPSDKKGLRPILTEAQIEANRVGIVRVVDRIVGQSRHVQNSEWLDRLSFMDFLRGPAREFTLNRMLATDIVARRIEANLPMTIMELCYSMMQGMDFENLFAMHGVTLQIGGSDQWSNILAGVELVRRNAGGRAFGLTTPLMLDEQGRKMGKTAEGQAVWLTPDFVSSHDLWQFWRNVPDAKVAQFLGLFTELPMDEVRRLSALEGAEINVAKTTLATEAVAIAHGREEADRAAAGAASLFGGAGDVDEVPTFRLPRCEAGITMADLAVRAGLSESKAAARRLAEQKGLRIDATPLADANARVESVFTLTAILSAGKKRKVRVEIV